MIKESSDEIKKHNLEQLDTIQDGGMQMLLMQLKRGLNDQQTSDKIDGIVHGFFYEESTKDNGVRFNYNELEFGILEILKRLKKAEEDENAREVIGNIAKLKMMIVATQRRMRNQGASDLIDMLVYKFFADHAEEKLGDSSEKEGFVKNIEELIEILKGRKE